jgi:uncharacterized protein DUF3800
MRIFFMDESGDPAPGGTQHLVLGGVILRCEDWPGIRSKLDLLKSELGINPHIEVKWRHVRHPGGRENPLRALSDAERGLFGRQVLGLVRGATHARVIGVVIDKLAAYGRTGVLGPDDLYEVGVTVAMERFQYYLRAAKDLGIVVQDQRHPKQDIRLRAFYRSLLTSGSYWTRFPSVIEGVFLSPSHFSTGIQLADFTAGAIYAAHCSPTKDLKYFNIIRGKITGDRHTGKRHGFKLWP